MSHGVRVVLIASGCMGILPGLSPGLSPLQQVSSVQHLYTYIDGWNHWQVDYPPEDYFYPVNVGV